MITLKKVSKNFGSFHAVQSVSIHIPEGQIHGIVGESGAGKSTLLRIINLLEKPNTGKVIVDQNELNNLSNRQLRHIRQSIGMIFQGYHLIENKNVYDNISVPLEIAKVPKHERKKRILESLRFVGLEHLQKQYPNQLSGGQKQRVAIARAIVNEPKILLCDEPTSSLDPSTTVEILKVLKRINEKLNVTIVIVSHEMDVIKSLCNRVTIIENGKVFDAFDLEPTGVHHIKHGTVGFVEQLKSTGGAPFA